MKSFNLEKSWRSSGTGNTTFNATGNFTVPFGKSVIGITGRGGTGNPGNPGSYEPGGTNSPYYAAGNPGNPNPGGSNPGEYVPGYVDPNYGYGYSGFYVGGNPNPGGENPGSFTPGNPGNPPSYTPGPQGNPNPPNPGSYTAGNPGNPNPPGSNPPNAGWYIAGNYDPPGYSPGDPATPGTPTTVLGVYFPGGASGTASVIPLTTVNAYAYTWPSSYPVTVPSGGYITIQLL